LELLTQHIESLIFASEQAISVEEIYHCLEQSFETEMAMDEIRNSVNNLLNKYSESSFGIEIVEINGGYQFMTKGAYHHSIAILLKQANKKRLTVTAMETLAIIAYKQPVSKVDLEKIRGVNCDYSVQKLLEKELISIAGRSDGPGKPILYATSDKFMDYFGLKSLSDLPKLKEFQTNENEIGNQTDIEVGSQME
jgi:segregation and condensation protein B